MKNFKYILLSLLIGIFSCSSAQDRKPKTFVAYNDITIKYELIHPENYDIKNSYEIAFLFTETAQKDNEWKTAYNLIQETVSMKNVILVVPKVPLKNAHWMSHPIHHALNAMMDFINKEYGTENQKIHFIGYKSGQEVAQTYANMSSQYIASYSIIHGTYWKRNKQEWFNQVIDKDIPVYVFEKVPPESIPLNTSETTYSESDNLTDALQKIDAKIREI